MFTFFFHLEKLRKKKKICKQTDTIINNKNNRKKKTNKQSKKRKKIPLRGFSLRRYAVTRYAVTCFTNNHNFIRTSRRRHLGRQGRATFHGSFCTFYLYNVLLQWLAKTFLITFTAKGFNLHQSKSKILEGLQSKIYSVSPVQTRDRSCGTLTFPCHANNVRDVPTEIVRIDLSARVFLSVSHVCFDCAHSHSKVFLQRKGCFEFSEIPR